MADSAAQAHELIGGVTRVGLAEPCRARCACEWEGPVTEWAGAQHAARLPRAPVPPLEHRLVCWDVQSCLSGPSERLTCACGWEGHSTRWNSPVHASRIPGAAVPVLPPPPPPPPPRISRAAYLDAVYGESRAGRRSR